MMGELAPPQSELFYGFCLEKHIAQDHLLRQIDRIIGAERKPPLQKYRQHPSITTTSICRDDVRFSRYHRY